MALETSTYVEDDTFSWNSTAVSERVEKETGGHCGVNRRQGHSGPTNQECQTGLRTCEHAVINTKQPGC